MPTKKITIALLALAFFVPVGASADYIQDYYTAQGYGPDVSSSYPVNPDGTGFFPAGPYILDAWGTSIGSTTPNRCAQGSSIAPSNGLNFYINQPGCTYLATQAGSSTVAVAVAQPGGFALYSGVIGGSVWGPYIPYDGNSSTHVIRINSPEMYATTTSPVVVDFDYMQGDPAPAVGYDITFIHTLTGSTKTNRVYFDGGGSAGMFNATTSMSLATAGTWKVGIALFTGSPDIPNEPVQYLDYSDYQYFAIGAHDNYQAVEFGPETWITYPASSCEINFLGTFNFSDCLGYLMVPASTSVQSLTSITLANRFPFAYAYDVGQIRTEIFENAAGGTTTIGVNIPGFGQLTFLSAAMISAVPFAGTIRTILAMLMWLLTAEFLYRTILRSHNQNTGV